MANKIFTSESWDEFSSGIANLKTKINNIINGTQVVSKATSATSSTYATTSTKAGTATYATSAGSSSKATSATSATYATTATKAGSANSASTATVDNKGQAITGYIKGFGISGKTVTITKGDGTTATYTTQDTNTTYSNYKGATTASSGTAGLVPAATTATRTKFLRGDGTWATPSSATSATVATSATYASTSTKAGTSTYSTSAGSASTATKLKTSRTVRTNLASTATASFDGTANITPGVTGVLPVANGGTGNSSVDTTPTSGSTKMVTSGGVYAAISAKANTSDFSAVTTTQIDTLFA